MSTDVYHRIHYALHRSDGTFIGCGWSVSDLQIITCAHVVSSLTQDVLALRSFCRSDVRRLSVSRTTGTDNPLRDATLLSLKPMETPLCSEGEGVQEPTIGQAFSVFGFPTDKPTLGDFARYEIRNQLPNGWFHIEILNQKGSELREGYSGAPAWDPLLGCAIGIIVGVDPHRSQQIAYLIPPSVLRAYIGVPPGDRYPFFDAVYHHRVSATVLSEPDVRRLQRYLSAAVDSVNDGVQRYWIYSSLGELAPDEATYQTLSRAEKVETDDFARQGAREALSKFPA